MNKKTMTMIAGLLLAGSGVTLHAADAQSGLPPTERTQNINANTAESPVTPTATPAPAPAGEKSAPAAQSPVASGGDTAERTGFSRGSVTRATFTSSIDNREPVDTFDKYQDDNGRVYFFTELRDMSGQTAKHRWEHNGKVMAEVAFNVKGSRWRVWSSKKFQPSWEGEWKVSVLNGANEVISEKTLQLVGLQMPASNAPAQGAGAEVVTPGDPASAAPPSAPPTVE